jgi:hypothetical protein
MDFVAAQLQDGTRFRSLTIVDVYTRQIIAIEAGQSLKGDDVVRTLNRVKLELRSFVWVVARDGFVQWCIPPSVYLQGGGHWIHDKMSRPEQG